MQFYVQRGADGVIQAVFPSPRPDWSPPTDPDPLADDAPELVAFLGSGKLVSRLLTPVAFFERFAPEELNGAFAVFAGEMFMITLRGVADLDHPSTAGLLSRLEVAGVLSAARRSEIGA